MSESHRRRWRRLVEIARTKPAYSDMAREVEENPDIKAELLADEFVGRYCVRCSSEPTELAEPLWFTPCPKCLGERMRRLMARRNDVPWWVEWVALCAEDDVEHQEARVRRALEVGWGDLWVCGRCGRLITPGQARYWTRPGGNISHPHCIPCRETLARGEG